MNNYLKDNLKDIEPKENNKPRLTFELKSEVVRIGEYDWYSHFNFNTYSTTAFSKIEKEITKIEHQPIPLENNSVEVEIYYNDVVNIEKSEWVVLEDPENPDIKRTPKLTKWASAKIEKERAIAAFTPYLYRHGGFIELQFRYVLKDGTKGVQSWQFKSDN